LKKECIELRDRLDYLEGLEQERNIQIKNLIDESVYTKQERLELLIVRDALRQQIDKLLFENQGMAQKLLQLKEISNKINSIDDKGNI